MYYEFIYDDILITYKATPTDESFSAVSKLGTIEIIPKEDVEITEIKGLDENRELTEGDLNELGITIDDCFNHGAWFAAIGVFEWYWI